MKLFYSPSEQGFFDTQNHKSIPSDGIEISSAEHEAILAGLENGQIVEIINGRPVAMDRPAPDPAQVLAAWRDTKTIPRTQFCLNCKRAGLLSGAEAISAARGEWPSTFAAALIGLPMDADEAQIIWAALSEVHRNDPVLEEIRVFKNLTHEEVDALFGGPPQFT